MKQFLSVVLLFTSLFALAQTGDISGIVLDKDFENQPLPFADVYIKGTTKGVSTDFEGKFLIQNVDIGTKTLVISFVGYETKEVTVIVEEGKTTTVKESLGAGESLEAVIVQGTSAVKESEASLIREQKKSVEIKTAIGAIELSKKGVSDAAAAVTKISGVTKQQGVKNVFVRGLGDRYNTTTLNGLPLPSENPDLKNLDLGFFSTDIIQNINVNKTNNAGLYGDASGANIDIVSKEFSGKSFLEVSASSGVNTQTVDKNFKTIDGSSTSLLGIVNTDIPVDNLDVYSFDNDINTNNQSFQHNSSFKISGGKKFNIGENSLRLFATAGASNDFQYLDGFTRQTTASGIVFRDQQADQYSYNVQQQFLGNLKYKFGQHSISINSLYIHKNTQNITELFGEDTVEEEGDLRFLSRQQVNDNSLYVNQLISKFQLTEKLKLNASIAYNYVRGIEPDRRSFNLLFRNEQFVIDPSSAGNNQRYFSDLKEDDYASNINFNYDFTDEENNFTRNISVGYNFRKTLRDFRATVFNHDFRGTTPVNINNLDATFNQENLDNDLFNLVSGRARDNFNPRTFVPFLYDGDRTIHGVFTKLNYQFNDKLSISLGIRYEYLDLEVDYDTNIANSDIDGIAKIEEGFFLPSINLKYSLNEKTNLRLSSSLSYVSPQFLEIAPFLYEAINFSVQGNPNIEPSDVFNIDFKYEYFFDNNDLVSLTGFYKNITDPISRAEVPSAGNTLTFLNVGDNAFVAGAEIEFKKSVFNYDHGNDAQSKLSFDFNGSYLFTEQETTNSFASFTDSENDLQGATPILINSSINYSYENNDKKLSSALVVNYYNERVFSIGTRGFTNIVEKGVPTLDYVSKYNFNKKASISLKVKNILNPTFSFERESGENISDDIALNRYKRGVNFTLGFNYRF